MAIIGKIRSYSVLLIIIIGVALAAFILGDFVKGGGNQQVSELAKINGDDILITDFQKKVDEQVKQLQQQSSTDNLSSDQVVRAQQNAWNQILFEKIMDKEYQELGLAIKHDRKRTASISPDEFMDLIRGDNPHPYIVQNFTNPETGQFDKSYLNNFLNQFDQIEQETKDQWAYLETAIKADRLNKKYLNLIKKSYYVPKALAEREYYDDNNIAKIRLFGLKYTSLPDSTISLTEDDYKAYYDAHINEYEQTESRDVEYVVFEVRPSQEDIIELQNEIAKIHEEFTVTDNVADFVDANSDRRYDSTFYKKDELSPMIDSAVFSAEIGSLFGPYQEENSYKIARLVDIQFRPDSMKASHLLISYAGSRVQDETLSRTKIEAKSVADSLFEVIKSNPASLELIALQMSDDGSAKDNSGDLGWFADGQMVPEFNTTVFNARIGDVDLVETVFGYHIIKTTGKQELKRKARVAIVERSIEPSKDTYDEAYRQASSFSANNITQDGFEQAVEDGNLVKRLAEKIGPMANQIPGLENPRSLVKWMYKDDTKLGDVSSVFDFKNRYVVAVLTKITEEGVAPFEVKMQELEAPVLREKKGQILSEKINASLANGTSLDKLASDYNLQIDTIDFLKFKTFSLPGYGPEPKVVGGVFSMEKGSISKAIAGNTGVFVAELFDMVESEKVDDFTSAVQQQMNIFSSRVDSDTYKALEKKADITDNRRIFY